MKVKYPKRSCVWSWFQWIIPLQWNNYENKNCASFAAIKENKTVSYACHLSKSISSKENTNSLNDLQWAHTHRKNFAIHDVLIIIINIFGRHDKVMVNIVSSHDDVIKHFLCYWSIVSGIHRPEVDSLTKPSDAEFWCLLLCASEQTFE